MYPLDLSERCHSFKPSAINPAICRWWFTGRNLEQEIHYCGCPSYAGKECPSQGRNPQEQEEDSFE